MLLCQAASLSHKPVFFNTTQTSRALHNPPLKEWSAL